MVFGGFACDGLYHFGVGMDVFRHCFVAVLVNLFVLIKVEFIVALYCIAGYQPIAILTVVDGIAVLH